MLDKADTVHVVTGCTAVGKTELSLAWAEENDAEIVSCDSLLFYRDMDIGTAKPSREERERVRHHLVDIRSPSEQMDIVDYLDLAISAVQDIQSRGKRVLVTGGSGFYLKAFFEPVTDDVEVDDATRRQVESLYSEKGLPGCVEALAEWNPDGIENLDTENPRRVLRALERCMASGMTLDALREAMRKQENFLTRANKETTVLHRDKDELNDRIRRRVDQMLEQGLIDETKSLRELGFERNSSAAGAIGYRETLAFLDGEVRREDLAEKIAANTRKLAKKQRTWFRTQLPEHRLVDLSGDKRLESNCLFENSAL